MMLEEMEYLLKDLNQFNLSLLFMKHNLEAYGMVRLGDSVQILTGW